VIAEVLRLCTVASVLRARNDRKRKHRNEQTGGDVHVEDGFSYELPKIEMRGQADLVD